MSEDIFISFSSKDSYLVEQVVTIFKENKISYWFAPEKLAGKKHDEAIVPAIKSCKIFMIFLSENSRPRDGYKTSSWVRDELLTAREYECFFLPVKLDQTVDNETNNLMFKGLPNYFDLTIGDLTNRLLELKEFVEFLLLDNNYNNNEFTVENFQKERSYKLFKNIERNLKKGMFFDALKTLNNEPFLENIDKDYFRLLKTIVLMSETPIKDMDMQAIIFVSKNLKSLENTSYHNISLYLQSMLSKSYFDFNGIRNNITNSFNELKLLSKKSIPIKPKFYLMTRNIKNTISSEQYELEWL